MWTRTLDLVSFYYLQIYDAALCNMADACLSGTHLGSPADLVTAAAIQELCDIRQNVGHLSNFEPNDTEDFLYQSCVQ